MKGLRLEARDDGETETFFGVKSNRKKIVSIDITEGVLLVFLIII